MYITLLQFGKKQPSGLVYHRHHFDDFTHPKTHRIDCKLLTGPKKGVTGRSEIYLGEIKPLLDNHLNTIHGINHFRVCVCVDDVHYDSELLALVGNVEPFGVRANNPKENIRHNTKFRVAPRLQVTFKSDAVNEIKSVDDIYAFDIDFGIDDD